MKGFIFYQEGPERVIALEHDRPVGYPVGYRRAWVEDELHGSKFNVPYIHDTYGTRKALLGDAPRISEKQAREIHPKLFAYLDKREG